MSSARSGLFFAVVLVFAFCVCGPCLAADPAASVISQVESYAVDVLQVAAVVLVVCLYPKYMKFALKPPG